MWNNKIATAIFRTSQCQDGDEVLKFYEMDVRALKDVLENLKTHERAHQEGFSVTSILSKNSELLKLNLSSNLLRAWSSQLPNTIKPG